jgi:carbon storage regulator CsrA
VGETFILDGNIEITLMDIEGDHAEIRIDASKEMDICREEEIYEGLSDYCAPPYG